jgi:ATP diphosphatase
MMTPHPLTELARILQRLRDPETGCPWSLQQTYASIVPHTLEEAYEVADAVDRNDIKDLQDELGDLLLQVMFYAQMAQERGDFTLNDVIKGVSEKMYRRHPHVFADEEAKNVEMVNKNWNMIKQQEREAKGKIAAEDDLFAGISQGLPSLKYAQKLKQRSASIGFDWQNWQQAAEKVQEELDEVIEAAENAESSAHIEEEVGDLLFASATLASHLSFDAENALRKGNNKFKHRITWMTKLLAEQGLSPAEASREQMGDAWTSVKKQLKQKEQLTPEMILNTWYSATLKPAWFSATPDIDQLIKTHFETAWLLASRGELDAWRETPEGCLALVIILDQFPLNMYRNQPKSFSTEAKAVEVTLHAIAKGFDKTLAETDYGVAFLYMPLMHSESNAHQILSVQLFAAAGLKDNQRFAEHHQRIVRRFNRFPHRNAILGRESTFEESEYLQSAEAFKG